MEDPSSGFAVQQLTQPQIQFPEHEQLRCPRCDSTNTKFCYYNNYNLSQPRHFCKSCRRYWTKGGALRNIPVGGGTRKSSSSSKRSNSLSSKRSPSSSSNSNSNSASASSGPRPGPVPVSGLDVPPASFGALLGGSGQLGSFFEGLGSVGPGLVPAHGDGPGLGFQAGGGHNGGDAGCWDGGSGNNGWPDLAIFTPGSKIQ